MKLSQVLFALFILVGMVSVQGTGTAAPTPAPCREILHWNSTTLDVVAHCVDAEVAEHWTEALANYDPYDNLLHGERLQLYNMWKVEAWAIVNDNATNARFILYKNVQPQVQFYNTFASSNACPNNQTYSFSERVGIAMNGILGSSVLEDAIEDFLECGGNRRMLRGQHRELPGGCGYYCGWFPGRRRRRNLQSLNSTHVINLSPNTPEKFEALVQSVKVDIQDQCEKLLHAIALYDATLGDQCKNALQAAACEVFVEPWEYISLEVGNVEMQAGDMIRAMLSVASGGGR